jgi:hypothetical protein
MQQLMLQEQLVRKLCTMYNTKDASMLKSIATSDLRYESQWVLDALHGQQNVIDYLTSKFKAIADSGVMMHAEFAWYGKIPCAILSQDSRENKVATVMAEFTGGKITAIDICAVPWWQDLHVTGEYPGDNG